MEVEEGLGEESSFPVEPVVDGSGGFKVGYPTAILELDEGVSLRVVPVAEFDDRCLVAVPFSTWHRKVARRVLSQGSLIRAVTVELAACKVEERETVLAQVIKVWMGFLQPSLVEQLYLGEGREAQHEFLLGESSEFLPSAQSLRDAAQEHFAFMSAAEEALVAPVAESGLGMEGRMDRVEGSISQLTELVQSLLDHRDPPGPSSQPRPPALRPKPKPPSAKSPKKDAVIEEKYPALDPAVAAAAMGAGVGEDAMKEMQRLLMVGSQKSRKFPESRVTFDPSTRGAKTRVQAVLSESEEEEELGTEHDSGLESSGQDHVQAALLKLTSIASALTSDKVKRTKVSKVEAALDGISSSGLTEGSGLGSGKRAAAARRVLRASLQENPADIHMLVEKLMLEDLCHQTMTPGQPAPRLCARAWLEHRAKIGAYRTSAQAAWSACGALDSLIGGDIAGARARICLLILMLDQAAVDRGSWVLAAELGLEQGPPMAVLGGHHPPSIADGDPPYSRLLDARWAEVAVAHIRETDEYLVKRGKLGKRSTEEDVENPKRQPNPKTKAGAKKAAAPSGAE